MSGTAVTFTAAISNGGSSPSYQWYINGNTAGSNASTFTTSALADGDQVSCVLTSNYSCLTGTKDTSNILGLKVHSNNNEPCNAISLAIKTSCSVEIYSNAGATKSSGVSDPSCAGTSTNDVWFKFVAPRIAAD
jgi:hypothetical protein